MGRYLLLLFVFALTELKSENLLLKEASWLGNHEALILDDNSISLNAMTAGSSWVSKGVQLHDNVQFLFSVKLDFDPSVNNNVMVFLSGDSSELNQSRNALYCKIGESGSKDGVQFYLRKAGVDSLLVNLLQGELGAPGELIKIGVKKKGGVWRFAAFSSVGIEKAGFDFTVGITGSASYFGVSSKYTKSNVKGVEVSSMVVWDEGKTFFEPEIKLIESHANYLKFYSKYARVVSDQVKVDVYNVDELNLYWNNDTLIQLLKDSLTHGDQDGDYTAKVTFVDVYGRVLDRELSFEHYVLKKGDVIFSELMIRPEGATGRDGGAKFVELYNASGHTIQLNQLELWVNLDVVKLPSYELEQGEFCVLVESSENEMGTEGLKGLLVLDDWVKISKTKNSLELRSGSWVVNKMEFRGDELPVSYKSEGGWSLENTIEGVNCYGIKSWKYSVSKEGATPGKVNSVQEFGDGFPLYIENVSVVGPDELLVRFSIAPSNFDESKLSGSTIMVNSVITEDDFTYKLLLNDTMVTGKQYWISFSTDIEGCGKTEIERKRHFSVGLPEKAILNDVVVNELLFDPSVGVGEFVELKNVSKKIIDLGELFLCEKEGGEVVGGVYACGGKGQLLLPDSVVCLTKNKESLIDYFGGRGEYNIHELKSLINMKSTGGTIGVMDRGGSFVDFVQYGDEFHDSTLSVNKGVSLERGEQRVGYDKGRIWNSSSSECNFGTPGYDVERRSNEENIDSPFKLRRECIDFSQSDQEVLQLDYQLPKKGFYCSVSICDANGEFCSVLYEKELFESRGVLNVNLKKFNCLPGLTILKIEAVHQEGEKFSEINIVSVLF